MMISDRCASLLCSLVLAACGGGEAGRTTELPTADADVTMLFMGNSHTSNHDIPGTVAAMMRAGLPGKTVVAVQAPGGSFLEERLNEAESVALLNRQNWTFVVLQAQKYSTSGTVEYSTAEARQWVRMSRRQQALPTMFPEWPRRGVAESQRIYDVHVAIARAEPVCVAAIAQAFDLARARQPALALHDGDGNHAAPAGAFLASLVLYGTLTGRTPSSLPHFAQFDVSAESQAFLRAVAADIMQSFPARQWCPGDPAPWP